MSSSPPSSLPLDLNHPAISTGLFFPQKCPESLSGSPAKQLLITFNDVISASFFVPANSPSEHLVVFFHGNGELGYDWSFHPLIGFLRNLPLNILLFEYRGYGTSTGQASLGNVFDDVEALPAYVRDRMGFDLSKVFVFGRSLGSIFAVHFAYVAGNVAGMVLESGMLSLYDFFERFREKVLKNMLKKEELTEEQAKEFSEFHASGGLKTLFLARANTQQKLQNYSHPLLVIHTKDDTVLPLEQNGNELFKEASTPATGKAMLTLTSGGHNSVFTFNQEEYSAALRKFFGKNGVVVKSSAAGCCSVS